MGLLEWIQAHPTLKRPQLDPAKCELIPKGPHGPVLGKLTRQGGRMKFVPDGTLKLKLRQDSPLFLETSDPRVIGRAAANADRKRRAEAYWRRHAAVL